MGFNATEAVEALTYDFRPHAELTGTIPEPTSDAIDEYRAAMIEAFRATGIDPAEKEEAFSFDKIDALLEMNKDVEAALVTSTATLTQIEQADVAALPYRVKRAFLGWIMGQFFDPEA